MNKKIALSFRFAVPVFLIAGIVFSSFPSQALALDTGFLSPTVSVDGDADVGTPNNAFISDNAYAVINSQDDEVDYTTFGIPAIPGGMTVTGIEVAVEANRPSGSRTVDLSLSWNNGTNFTSVKNVGAFTSSDSVITAGSPTDAWGRAWSAGEFTNANFRLRVDAVSSGAGEILNIDRIQVKVHYIQLTCVAKSGSTFSSVASPSDDNDWDTEGNAVSSDDGDATVSLGDSQQSEYLQATGFGFAIPTGSTVYGISVGVERGASQSDEIDDYLVRTVKGGVIGTDTNHDGDFSNWPSADTTVSYGSATDMWGTTWTSAQINASNFGVAFSAQHDGSGGADTATVDHITMTVCYEAPGHIIVDKVTNPSGSAQSFSFDAVGTGYNDFSLTDAQAVNDQTLAPGNYSVSETLPAGWAQSSVSCLSSLGGSENPASIGLTSGETVTCTFNNTAIATVSVSKIVCGLESDLPNWGDGFGGLNNDEPVSIDEDTAQEWIDDHESCDFADDWQFQWSPHTGVTNPGDEVGIAGGTWTTFDNPTVSGVASTQINASAVGGRVWFREVFQSGYLPFSGENTVQDVSAELFCSTDGLNYDNVDYVDLPVGGQTYYCVAWNVEVGTISGQKFEDLNGDGDKDPGELGLAGWTIELRNPTNVVSTTVTGVDGSYSFTNLVSGNYNVTEVNQAGWTQTSPNPTSFFLNPGADIEDVDFGNFELVTITVEKDVQYQNGDDVVDNNSFDVKLDAGSFQAFSENSSVQFTNVGPGLHTLTEDAETNYDISLPVEFTPTSGVNETITIINKQQNGSITIKKLTVGGDADFTFTGDVSGSLSNDEIATQEVVAGTYSSTETPLAGWDLTALTCNDSDSTGNIGTGVATFNVGINEDVTCTFTNEKDANIIVEKQTLPDGSDVVFDFDLSYGDNDADLSDDQQDDSGDLNPGTYSVAENTPAGWDTTVSCLSSLDGSEDASNIGLTAGETVTCVFLNTERGNIVVDKVTLGGDATFSFDTNGGTDPVYADFSLSGADTPNSQQVKPGEYSVSETVLGGWSLTEAVCDSGETIEDIDVEPGETVTCTFTNTKLGSISGQKFEDLNGNGIKDDGEEGLEGWTINLNPGGSVETDEDGNYSFNDLLPGSYMVSETQEEGWTPTVPAPSGYVVVVDAGENEINKDFGNFENVTVTVVKNVVAPDGVSEVSDSNEFDITFDLTPEVIAEGNDAVFTNVGPGVHTLVELIANDPDYDLIDIDPDTDNDPSNGGTFAPTSGTDVTITVTNKQHSATITLVKNLPNDDGGNAVQADFTVTLDEGAAQWGANVVNPGTYTLDESELPGYVASGWTCGENENIVTEVSVVAGQSITCQITNDDQPAKLTVIKHVINDNGGTGVASNFNLIVNGANPNPADQFPGSEEGTVVLIDSNTGYGVAEPIAEGYGVPQFSEYCTGAVGVGLDEGEEVTCIVTNNDLAPSLTLVKVVEGSDEPLASWTLTATGASSTPTNLTGTSPVVSGSNFAADTYTLDETDLPGYTASDWICVGDAQAVNGVITLANGDSATCTITNTRDTGSIELIKDFVGTPENVTLNIGTTPNDDDVDTETVALDGTTGANTVDTNTYYVSEVLTNPSNYETSLSCTSDGDEISVDQNNGVVVANDAEVICTFTNTRLQGTLTVTKLTPNDNGGDVDPEDFSFSVNGGNPIVFEEDGTNELTLDTGTYSVVETNPQDGYTLSYGNSENQDLNCTLLNVTDEGNVTCTITNDDNAPSLTLVKEVINDNGGEAEAGDFTLTAEGYDAQSPEAGTYDLSESGPSGYSQTSLTCSNSGDAQVTSVTLGLDEDVTCTFVNDDIAGTLIVKKVLTQDNGGTLEYDDFSFKINGGDPIVFDIDGQNEITVDAGDYLITEVSEDGYATSYQNCDVTVANDGVQTCVITNNDIAPTLELQKNVVGGPLSANAWNLKADGPTTISGNGGVESGPTFSAGTYTLTETSANPGAIHYTTDGAWSCIGEGNEITLALGDEVECEITNTYVAPGTITIEKQTLPDGSEVSFEFDPSYGENFSLTDGQASTSASLIPGTYSVSELTPGGWTLESAICSDGSQVDAIDLDEGETVTCVFTNTQHGNIVVQKVTQPTGSEIQFEFDPSYSDNFFLTDLQVNDYGSLLSGTYSVSELTPDGWTLESAICSDGSLVSEINLAPGETVTCVFTNSLNPTTGTIVVQKVIVGNEEADPEDFEFTVQQGDAVVPPQDFDEDGENELLNQVPGEYLITEVANPDYNTTYENCSFTLSVGETETCTITNTFDPEPVVSLIVEKVIVGGGLGDTPDDFSFNVDKQGNGPAVLHQFEVDGENEIMDLENGAYDVTEVSAPGWTTTYSSDAPGNHEDNCNNIAVDGGNGVWTCTITNTKVVEEPELCTDPEANNPGGPLPCTYDEVENSCPLPQTLGDESAEEVNGAPNGEDDLQEILDSTIYDLDVDTDQEQYQVWNVNANSEVVIDPIVFINEFAGHSAVFGYYTDGDMANFVGVFRTGDIPGVEFDSLPLASSGPFNANTGEADTIGFAIKTWNGEASAGDFATENSLNTGSSDQVLVYNPASNTYVLAFEDVVGGDSDYNDLVVKVVLSCELMCVPTAIETVVVSDTTTLEGGLASALVSPLHIRWTAIIGGASWIWGENPISDNTVDLTETFTKTFNIVGTPTGASLDIAADNSYKVWVNETPDASPLCEDPEEWNYQFPGDEGHDGQDTCAIPAEVLVEGENTIHFEVKNFGNPDANEGDNPAGLLYKLTIGSNQCVPETPVLGCTDPVASNYNPNATEDNGSCLYPDPDPEDNATIHVTKIVCDAEVDLPNWGDGLGGLDNNEVVSIDANTASNFLSNHIGTCEEVDWTFEYAFSPQANPGDSVVDAGSPWTNFEDSVTVPEGSSIRVREHFNSLYIPFSGLNTDQEVSAELYCANDVLHYDNFDFINSVQGGEDYYCVAWNVPVEAEEEEEEEEETPTTECSDGVDNSDEEDGLVDSADPGCHTDGDAENSESYDEEDDDEGNEAPQVTETDDGEEDPDGGSVHRTQGQFSGSVAGASAGQVFGQSCGLYMDKFIRFGSRFNDVEQVTKLQTFLNKWMGSNLAVTGVYDAETLAVLKAFQAKYASEILTPWGLNEPTGIVYLSTLRWINMLECPDLALLLPTLINWSDNPNTPKEPLATSNSGNNSAVMPNTGGPDEEGDEFEDEDQTASVIEGDSSNGGGFWGFLKRLFGN